MTTRTTQRTTCIALAVQVVLAVKAPPSHCLLLTVSCSGYYCCISTSANQATDSKQARDLVQILKEANQAIDPRLAEMVRYSGGGGGRGWGGHRGGRGRGGGGGGWTGSNNAPLGGNRRW